MQHASGTHPPMRWIWSWSIAGQLNLREANFSPPCCFLCAWLAWWAYSEMLEGQIRNRHFSSGGQWGNVWHRNGWSQPNQHQNRTTEATAIRLRSWGRIAWYWEEASQSWRLDRKGSRMVDVTALEGKHGVSLPKSICRCYGEVLVDVWESRSVSDRLVKQRKLWATTMLLGEWQGDDATKKKPTLTGIEGGSRGNTTRE